MPHILGPHYKTESNGSGQTVPHIATPALRRSWTFADSSREFEAETVAPREFEPGTREMGRWPGGWSGLLTNFAVCGKVTRREPPAEAAHRPNAFAASLASRGLVGHGVSNRCLEPWAIGLMLRPAYKPLKGENRKKRLRLTTLTKDSP
jgi:hypothetical protein